MKRIRWVFFAGILALTLCISLSTALAANSTSVILNCAKLTAANPYWVNGTEVALATPPASGWNAYFDVESNTLMLNNADVNLPSSVSVYPGDQVLVYADGDISLELTGDSTGSFSSSLYSRIIGLAAGGSLSIGGSGNIDIQVENIKDSSTTFGIKSEGDLSILSGNVTVDSQSSYLAFGISTRYDTLFAGGNVQVNTESSIANNVYCYMGDFRMTGGSLTLVTESKGLLSAGINVVQGTISLEGGTANVLANYGSDTYALFFQSDHFSYTGGNYTFTGIKSAMRYTGHQTAPAYAIDGGTVHVSEYLSGDYPTVWRSGVDGMLASNNTDTSPFKFVQFVENVYVPQTGDADRPLLWLGISASTLLGMFGFLAMNKKVRKRNIK